MVTYNTGITKCPGCGKTVKAKTFHAGYSDQYFFYCNSCPTVAVLEIYGENGILSQNISEKMPRIQYLKKIVASLKQCGCGGSFSLTANPRCPYCNHKLPQWGKGRMSPWYFIVNNKVTENNWKDAKEKGTERKKA